MADHGHGNHRFPITQTDTAHACAVAALKDADIGAREADRAPPFGDQHHIVFLGADARIHKAD